MLDQKIKKSYGHRKRWRELMPILHTSRIKRRLFTREFDLDSCVLSQKKIKTPFGGLVSKIHMQIPNLQENHCKMKATFCGLM